MSSTYFYYCISVLVVCMVGGIINLFYKMLDPSSE
jgi:hypothetical protein